MFETINERWLKFRLINYEGIMITEPAWRRALLRLMEGFPMGPAVEELYERGK
jgi:hypothetical protein